MPKRSNNGQKVPSTLTSFYLTHPAQRARVSMIATPLGNLADLSERVIHALFHVDELWCEDTRHTQALLQALQNSGRAHAKMPYLRRLDQHTDPDEIHRWLSSVAERGQWIGVVTDAGTPGVSDPGGKVTQAVATYPEIRLEAIPGPSAVSALVSIAGFEENSFIFQGFFPREASKGLELLNQLKGSDLTRNWIFFESPQRIRTTVETLAKWIRQEGENVAFEPEFVFAKELTKLHETVFRSKGESGLECFLAELGDDRGEWCWAVILPKSYVIPKKMESDWELALECLIEAKISPKEASQLVMQRFSVAKNLAYRTAIDLQKKVQKKVHPDDSGT